MCLFGVNASVVEMLADFVSRMHKEEQMLLDYLLRNAALMMYTPSIL